MYRAGVRTASRQTLSQLRLQTLQCAPRRFASTATPASKSRSWKSSAVRWGLAIGAVYYYNASSVFADEVSAQPTAAPRAFDQADLQTVDSVIEEKRKQLKAKAEEVKKATETAATDAGSLEKQPEIQSQNTAVAGSPAALEEEAGQEGAFNPETGEINWDCPCLGGMAHGPCGEEFKTAFSCFVYSDEDPKGMDCIDKFQGMQECFKKYPEIYAAELSDDEADEGNDSPDVSGEADIPAHEVPADSQTLRANNVAAELPADETEAKPQALREDHRAESSMESGQESHGMVERNEATGAKAPKAWEDATDANTQVAKDEKIKE